MSKWAYNKLLTEPWGHVLKFEGLIEIMNI